MNDMSIQFHGNLFSIKIHLLSKYSISLNQLISNTIVKCWGKNIWLATVLLTYVPQSVPPNRFILGIALLTIYQDELL